VITIFCGEDSSAARTAFSNALKKYQATGAEIISISPASVLDIAHGLSSNLSLFSNQSIFCVENLEKQTFKKSTKAKKDTLYESLVRISADKTMQLIDFEEGKQARLLKLKDLAKVHESAPSTTIFKLTDECYPGNKITFIQSLKTVCETQDEMFVLIMLFRHVRNLVLALADASSAKLPPWQKYKIIAQAKKWEKQMLLHFYSGLIKIEIGAKTSANPYGIAKSLEILACHYL